MKHLIKCLFLLFFALHAHALDRVDLHAHLFMHEGVGLSWMGSFTGPIRSEHWQDRLHSKVNAEALELSGSQLVAVALYSHPLFLGSERNSIRRQIATAEAFVVSHPDWVIARSLPEARQAKAAGKKILIFTLEGADGILESEADLKEFIDEQGIRIVTPLHFIDDQFGGAALMPPKNAFVNPFAWIRSFFRDKDVEGARLNDRGLTSRGEWLIRALLARGVWIDLSHSSDASQRGMREWIEKADQPLLYTHTMLRRFYHSERGVSAEQLKLVRQSGGIIGLLPSEDMMAGTQVEASACAQPCGQTCMGGVPALVEQFKEVSRVVGPDSVSLGTDINAPLNFIQPDCAHPEADTRGFYQYGQLGELWDAMRERGIGSKNLPGLTLEKFFQVWGRVRPN